MLCLGFFSSWASSILSRSSDPYFETSKQNSFGLSDPLQKLTVPFQHMIEK